MSTSIKPNMSHAQAASHTCAEGPAGIPVGVQNKDKTAHFKSFPNTITHSTHSSTHCSTELRNSLTLSQQRFIITAAHKKSEETSGTHLAGSLQHFRLQQLMTFKSLQLYCVSQSSTAASWLNASAEQRILLLNNHINSKLSSTFTVNNNKPASRCC